MTTPDHSAGGSTDGAAREIDDLQADAVPASGVDAFHDSNEQLIHSRTMESVTRLAGGLAHDFNNTLHVIRGNVSALQRLGNGDVETLDRRIATIVRAVDRTTALVARLALIGRSPTDRPTRVPVDQFLRELESDLHAVLGPDIALRLDLDAGDCAVLIDRGRFEDVLLHLVRNAHDAVELYGSVEISTQIAQGSLVSIDVSDSGIGMDRETASHMFEPFFSTKWPGVGVGLGLALASATIYDANGTIRVVSAPNSGTSVRFELPCHGITPLQGLVLADATVNHGDLL